MKRDADHVEHVSSKIGCKTSKTGLLNLENSKSETHPETQEYAQTCTTDPSWNDGLMNGMMTGVRLDGTKVGDKRMTNSFLVYAGRTVSSRERGIAEQCASGSNENCESRCGTDW